MGQPASHQQYRATFSNKTIPHTTMRRVAIIIASPLHRSRQYFLKGVAQDVAGYKSFLASATGGAYEPGTEIHSFVDPDYKAISKIRSLCRHADVAFVIFSGHGFMQGNTNYLLINEHQAIDHEELTTGATRQITLIDACRTGVKDLPFTGDVPAGYRFIQSHKPTARRWYNNYVKQCPPGKVWLFSASAGEPSADSEAGGQFSVSFLRSVERWANLAHQSGKILLPQGALKSSVDYLKRRLGNHGQRPTHEKAGWGERLPIAVGLPAVAAFKRQTPYHFPSML